MKKVLLALLFMAAVFLGACSKDEPELDYSDFDASHVTTFEAAETKNLDTYYVYYYANDCEDCDSIKEDFLNLIEDIEEKVYFVNVTEVTGAPTAFVPVEGEPSLVLFEGNEVSDSYRGKSTVLDFISSLMNIVTPSDYDQVEHISSWGEVYNRSEEEYIAYYYSPTCGYCNLIKDFMLEYSVDNDAGIKLYFLYASEMTGVNNSGLTGTPAIMHIKNGEVIYSTSGYISVQDYLLVLEGKDPMPTYQDMEHLTNWDNVLDQSEYEYFLYYYSPTCGYCNQIKTYMLNFANENGSNLKMYFLDAGYMTGTDPFDLTGTPTLLHVVNGEMVNKKVGSVTIPEYLEQYE